MAQLSRSFAEVVYAGGGSVGAVGAQSPRDTQRASRKRFSTDWDKQFLYSIAIEKERLIEAIGLTPFSREEFSIACTLDAELEPLERARRFYVRARQVRTGLAQRASIGRWANCKNTSRAGMSGVVSRWLGAVEDLPHIAERLLRVQIENRPATDVITLYDAPATLFYCDPPYLHESRRDTKAYGYEMSDSEHKELADVLNAVQGMVALSGYEHPLMEQWYPAPAWAKLIAPARTIHSTKDTRSEVLWVNARLREQGGISENRAGTTNTTKFG